MKDHMVRQADFKQSCPYCSAVLPQGGIDFDFERKYQVSWCSCGKKVIRFLGCETGPEVREFTGMHTPITTQTGNGEVQPLEARLKIIKEYENYNLQK